MQKIIAKLAEMERETSAERGPYTLFALFLRDESPNRWDIVAAAPWIDPRTRFSTIRYLIRKARTHLGEDILYISGVDPFPADDPAVLEVNRRFPTEGKVIELHNIRLLDDVMSEGYILTSTPVVDHVKAH